MTTWISQNSHVVKSLSPGCYFSGEMYMNTGTLGWFEVTNTVLMERTVPMISSSFFSLRFSILCHAPCPNVLPHYRHTQGLTPTEKNLHNRAYVKHNVRFSCNRWTYSASFFQWSERIQSKKCLRDSITKYYESHPSIDVSEIIFTCFSTL